MLLTMDVGQGPRKVFLLHGFLGSGRNLLSLARRWIERDPSLTLTLADLTGHGGSPPLPQSATIDDLAQDVLALSDGSPLEIAGHSLGGRVALAAARLDPGAVERVALLDIAPGPITDVDRDSTRLVEALLAAPDRASTRTEMRQALEKAHLPSYLTDWVLTNLVPRGDGYVWRFDRQALADLHGPVNEANLWPVVESGGLALLCVRGSGSRYVSDSDATRLERAGCKVVTIEAGHFLHVEAPGPLLDALVPFFKESRS